MISVLFLSSLLDMYFDKSTETVVKSCAVRLSTYICLQIIKKGQERKNFFQCAADFILQLVLLFVYASTIDVVKVLVSVLPLLSLP